MAFSIYKWRRDQLLLEDSTSNDAGGTELIKSKQYSKEDIMKAVGMYGKIKLGSGEAVPVSSLDNEGKYTYTMDSYSVSAQKAVPVFIPAGKPKSIGSSGRSIDFQIKADKAKGKKPMRGLDEIEGDPDDYYGYNEPIDPNDYADDNEGSGNQLADIIEDNKAALAKQFNLVDPMVSWNAEGEPVMMTDDNDEQVDFIKVEDWENNKGFYNRNDGVGEITLDGIDIIYVVNPFG
jgi:hypothetical protein